MATVNKIKRQVFHIAELCAGVGYGKSASPFHWGSTGASLEKLFFGGSSKVHFSALHWVTRERNFSHKDDTFIHPHYKFCINCRWLIVLNCEPNESENKYNGLIVPLETIMFSVRSQQLYANLTAILASHQGFWRTLYITEETLITYINKSLKVSALFYLLFVECLSWVIVVTVFGIILHSFNDLEWLSNKRKNKETRL